MRRFLLAVLLAAPLVAVPPATAEEATYVLQVKGTRSGYVDLRIGAGFSVDPFHQNGVNKGRVGGFYAERLDQPAGEEPRDEFGAIRVTHGTTVAKTWTAKPETDGPALYGAGRYRFHIVADAPFWLTVPLTGLGRSFVLTPRWHVATPKLSTVNGTQTGGAVWEAREALTIGAKRMAAVSASYVEWELAGVHHEVLCFAPAGGVCEPEHTSADNAQIGTGAGQRGTGSYFARPGALRNGRWDAMQRTTTAPGGHFRAMVGLAVVFEAPGG